jgi:hypothetical protein
LEEGIGIGDFMTNTVACDPDPVQVLERDSIAFAAASQFETELRRALDHEEFQVYIPTDRFFRE